MRLAMIARCRERGLGTMTWEFARHMQPDKVLVVRRDDIDTRDDQRFPGARWTSLDRQGRLPPEDVRWLTHRVDVLYSAETFYDDQVITSARQRGVRTVLHGMWEYLPYRQFGRRPRPDLFLAPNPWHLDEWPQPCTYLPVPVAADRFERRHVSRVSTIVHCAGAPAKGDRNGTTSFLEALRHVRSRVRVIVRSQTPLSPPRLPNKVELSIEPAATNYWQVFDRADAAVLPRRYGGLSLPLQEATALGLPIIGLAREHDAGYHHAAVVRCTSRMMGLPCGPVERAAFEPSVLARAIDHLVDDREQALEMAERSAEVARGLSWERLRATYSDVLGSVVGSCVRSTS